MYRTDFWTLWEKARVGCFKRTASKLVYYLGWNRSPAQVGCMRQVLGPGALGRPRGIGWRGRWDGGSGWRIHVYPWLIHVNVWQKPLQYCKVISLQLIKKKKRNRWLKTVGVLSKITQVDRVAIGCGSLCNSEPARVHLPSIPVSKCIRPDSHKHSLLQAWGLKMTGFSLQHLTTFCCRFQLGIRRKRKMEN